MKNINKHLTPDMVFQDEVSECGLASICMLVSMLGIAITMDELRSKFKLSSAGMSFDEIIDVLAFYNIKTIPISYDPKQVSMLPLPAILHHGGNHFVLASEKKGRYIKVMNPATGGGVYHEKDLHDRLTGFAIVLDSHQDFELISRTGTGTGTGTQRRFSLSSLVIPNLGKLLLCSFFFMMLSLSIPTLFFLLLEVSEKSAISSSANLGQLFWAVLIVVGTTAATDLFITKLKLSIANSVSTRYIPELFSSLLKKKYDFFEKRALSDIHQRFSSMSQAIIERASLVTSIKISIITCICAIAVMFWVHEIFGLMAIIVICLYGAISIFYAVPRSALIKRIEEASSIKNALFFETINGIATVKSAFMHNERNERFSFLHMDVMRIGNKLALIDAKQRVLFKLVYNMEFISLLAISMALLNKQELTIGGLFAFTMFKQIASSSATEFYMTKNAFKESEIIDNRSQSMISYPEDSLPVNDIEFSTSISLSNMSFSYEQSSLLYSSLDLKILKGEKIAITGESGCGKSSFLKLLSGLYTPSVGVLQLDNEKAHWDQLSRLTYYLQQHDSIFHASVMDNITLFKKEIKSDTVFNVVSMLGLKECIENLPHHWMTMISDINPLMSSGQRQRLLVARALCSEKPLLMIDEPTANLDKNSARQVMKAILDSDKTVLVALHDLELLSGFDRVIHIEGGHLIEH